MKKQASRGSAMVFFIVLAGMCLVGGFESFVRGSVPAMSTFSFFAFFSAVAAVGSHLQKRLSVVLGYVFSFAGIAGILVALCVLYFQARIPLYFVLIMVATVANTLLLVYLAPRARQRR